MTKQLNIEHFILGGNQAAAISILDGAGVYNEAVNKNLVRLDGTRFKPVSRAVAASGGIHCTACYKTALYGRAIIVGELNSEKVLIKL